jgi:tetratricopeptide (TPR) repeat protein
MKNLIREVHRRSLWQVLGIYLAVSWIVLQVIDVLGNNIGLPDWVGPTAFALLLVGLPIVVATAFVQEGLGARDGSASHAAPEEGPDQVVQPAVPETAEGHHRVFTWKNALLGGVAAFALLGILTAGYLFMRTSGIGPAATLVAQGVLEEGAEVLLADFESSDPDLADVVTGALRIDLVQSPTLSVVPRSELAGALRRMQRDEESAISGDVARELAVREGYPAIIEGEIGVAGSGYVLTASVLGGEAWEPLAGFRVTARTADDLIDAIEELSRDIRDKAGESLRSVQGGPGLKQVSTSSLEALRLYTRGETLENSDELGAVALYEQAVEIDPEFAMAFRKIGVGLGNIGVRRPDAVRALTRAMELRDRLPPAERYLAEAYYNSGVVGDRAATMRSYEQLLDVDPQSIAGLNNLGLVYVDVGRSDEAEDLLERAIVIEDFFVAYANLADARRNMGANEAAEDALDQALERMPRSASLIEFERARSALDRADHVTAAALIAAYGERFTSGRDVGRHASLRALYASARGREAEADAALDLLEGTEIFDGHPMRVAWRRASVALSAGDSTRASRILLDAYEASRDSLAPPDRIYGYWLATLAAAGAAADVERIHAEWRQLESEDELGTAGRDGRRRLDAMLAYRAGEFETAARLWDEHGRQCGGSCAAEASYYRAQMHEASGSPREALEEYERYLDGPPNYRAYTDLAYRGRVLERLSEIHEELGDAAESARYAGMLIDLWSEADEVFQPRVEAARARLASSTGAGP